MSNNQYFPTSNGNRYNASNSTGRPPGQVQQLGNHSIQQSAPRGNNRAVAASTRPRQWEAHDTRPPVVFPSVSATAAPGPVHPATSIVHRLEDFQPNEATKRASAPPKVAHASTMPTATSYKDSSPLLVTKPRTINKPQTVGNWSSSEGGNSNSLLSRMPTHQQQQQKQQRSGQNMSFSNSDLAQRIGGAAASTSTSRSRSISNDAPSPRPNQSRSRAPSVPATTGTSVPPLSFFAARHRPRSRSPSHNEATSPAPAASLRDRIVPSTIHPSSIAVSLRRKDAEAVRNRVRELRAAPAKLIAANRAGLTNVVLSNLPEHVCQRDIRENLAMYGPTGQVFIKPDVDRVKRKAEVTFKHAQDAACAVLVGNGERFWSERESSIMRVEFWPGKDIPNASGAGARTREGPSNAQATGTSSTADQVARVPTSRAPSESRATPVPAVQPPSSASVELAKPANISSAPPRDTPDRLTPPVEPQSPPTPPRPVPSQLQGQTGPIRINWPSSTNGTNTSTSSSVPARLAPVSLSDSSPVRPAADRVASDVTSSSTTDSAPKQSASSTNTAKNLSTYANTETADLDAVPNSSSTSMPLASEILPPTLVSSSSLPLTRSSSSSTPSIPASTAITETAVAQPISAIDTHPHLPARPVVAPIDPEPIPSPVMGRVSAFPPMVATSKVTASASNDPPIASAASPTPAIGALPGALALKNLKPFPFTSSGHIFEPVQQFPTQAEPPHPRHIAFTYVSPTYNNTNATMSRAIRSGIEKAMQRFPAKALKIEWHFPYLDTGKGAVVVYFGQLSAQEAQMRPPTATPSTMTAKQIAPTPIAVPSNEVGIRTPVSTINASTSASGSGTKRGRDQVDTPPASASSVNLAAAAADREKRPRVDESSVVTTLRDAPMVTLEDDVQVLRIDVPEAAKGAGIEAAKARKALRIREVKKAASEGKVVLSAIFRDNVLEISYEVDDDQADDPTNPVPTAAQNNGLVSTRLSSPRAPAASTSAPPVATSHLLARTNGDESSISGVDEDVKPVIRSSPRKTPSRNRPHDDEDDMDISDSASERDPIYFPREIKVCTADSERTAKIVEDFITRYFKTYDESRAGLVSWYHPESVFSVQVVNRVPPRIAAARQQIPISAFQKAYYDAANKTHLTSTAIVNCITRLPPGAHDIENIVYDARTVPQIKRKVPKLAKEPNELPPPIKYLPIVLHVHSTFEEFPTHIVRKVARTFVLVPRDPSMGHVNMAKSTHVIETDQVVFSHYDPNAPAPTLVDPALGPFPKRPMKAAAKQDMMADDGLISGSNTPARSASTEALSTAVPAPLPVANANVMAPAIPTSVPASAPIASTSSVAASSNKKTSADPSHTRSSSNVLGPVPPGAPAVAPVAPRATPAPPATPSRPNPDIIVISDSSDESDSDSAPAASGLATERIRGPVASPPNPLRDLPPPVLHPRRSSESSISSRQRSVSSADEAPAQPSRPSKKSKQGGVASSSTAVSLSMEEIERIVAKKVRAELKAAERKRKRSRSRRNTATNDSDDSDNEADEDDSDSEMEIVGGSAASGNHSDRSAAAARGKKRPKGKNRAADVSNGANGSTVSSGLSDGRIAIRIDTKTTPHGYDGKGNKMRWMVDIGSSFLGVSMYGDVLEWSGTNASGGVKKLFESGSKDFQVDDIAFSPNKNVLVVPYLGSKNSPTLETQVALFERKSDFKGLSKLVRVALKDQPHGKYGITATTVLSGAASARLQFVTAGDDKMMYLWTRARSDHTISTDRILCDHTSTVNSMNQLSANKWLISGGSDKRVLAVNIEARRTTWSAILPAAVHSVEPLPFDPHLILARQALPSDQFRVFDVRQSGNGSPVLTFGFKTPDRTAANTNAPVLNNLGRYYAGSPFREFAYAFPDVSNGIKLWDLRKATSALGGTSSAPAAASSSATTPRMQSMPGVATSKVVQVLCRNSEIALMEQNNFSLMRVR